MDTTKLPKWAQEHIRSLEGKVSALQENVETLKAHIGTTNVKVGGSGLESFMVPVHARYTFDLTGEGQHQDQITIHVTDQQSKTHEPELRASSCGRALRIIPVADNAIRLVLE